MRADYFSRPPKTSPSCPVCGAAHLRAENGAGFLVWCDGSPGETPEERDARDAYRRDVAAREASAQAQAKDRARIKRNARARFRRRLNNDRLGPIDAIDRGLPIPDTFPG